MLISCVYRKEAKRYFNYQLFQQTIIFITYFFIKTNNKLIYIRYVDKSIHRIHECTRS